jgi:polysaccharide biosynthesis/export protein
MLATWLRKFRFSLKSVLVLMLGIAIGYALNLQTLRLLLVLATGPAPPSPYTIEPPDVLRISVAGDPADAAPAISGEHLVGPDGRINLGAYGGVYVAGSTIGEAQDAIEQAVAKQIEPAEVVVDVASVNSKVYYILTEGDGRTHNVMRVPITGNETVLDAIAQIGGLKGADPVRVWIARHARNGVGMEKILPVEWKEIASGASTATNYQMLAGDRLYVSRKTSRTAN